MSDCEMVEPGCKMPCAGRLIMHKSHQSQLLPASENDVAETQRHFIFAVMLLPSKPIIWMWNAPGGGLSQDLQSLCHIPWLLLWPLSSDEFDAVDRMLLVGAGGGLPVGAYGGRRDIMEMVAPAGPMYQVCLSWSIPPCI